MTAATFTTDLFTGWATSLAAASLGLTFRGDDSAYATGETGIYDEAFPLDHDRAVALTFYTLSDDPTLSDSELGMQVKTRGGPDDPTDARDIDDALFDYLHGIEWLTLTSGLLVVSCYRSSATSLGQDDNKRWIRSSNYRQTLYRPSLHRV